MIGPDRAVLMTAAALGALLLGGCGYVAETAPVQAVTTSAPVHFLAEKAGAATVVPEAKPFVVETRRPVGDFIPVGVTPPDRPLKTRDAKGVETLRGELEGTDRLLDAKAKAP